ncbi:MAG: ribosome small subunit-dependent GTPase A [Clostridiaceae bacterium]|nr:ribosome small subunit-dependent GTPase A [Clostridiaceae bacterium]
MKKGRLIKGIGGFYYVDVEGIVYECKARGIFRQMKITPLVGDYVEITVLDEDHKKGVLEKIMERRTELIRPVVANVDQAIIVFAVTRPEPNITLLDRFLVLAESEDLDITICFNKADLATDNKHKELVKVYEAAGYKVILTSAKDEKSVKLLKETLADKTNVFAGPSGVGKSTLLNKIDSGLNLQTGEISQKNARGKHTTRHAELIAIENHGWVVDTPGFSSLDLDFIEEEDLALYFPEFAPYIEDCKFSTCKHLKEPKCAVKSALKSGEIYEKRYESYLKFMEEIKNTRRF